jgi:hypothetical protein
MNNHKIYYKMLCNVGCNVQSQYGFNSASFSSNIIAVLRSITWIMYQTTYHLFSYMRLIILKKISKYSDYPSWINHIGGNEFFKY